MNPTRKSIQVNKARPCPICGHDNWCRRYLEEGDDDRAALCMRPAGVGGVPGWKPIGAVGKAGGQVFRRTGPDGQVVGAARLTTEEQKKADAVEAARRQLQEAGARWVWARAGHDDQDGPAWAAGYVEARGVPLAALPGGKLPGSIRGLSNCPTSSAWPPPPGQDGFAWKGEWRAALVAAVIDSQDRLHGLQRIFLEADEQGRVRKSSAMADRAKLCIGSFSDHDGACRLGVDYSGGILVLCEGVETGLALLAAGCGAVWACISTSGLLHVAIPAELKAKGIHTVVIAADFDRPDPRRGHTRPGTHAAQQCAARLRWTYHGLRVGIAEPGRDDCPELIDAQGELLEGQKTADWMDAYTHRGGDHVRAAILRAAAMADGRAVEKKPDAAKLEAAFGRGGGGGGEPGGPAAGGGAQADEGDRYISKVPLYRARRMLVDRFSPDEGGRWRIACWQEEWFAYKGGVWRKVKYPRLRAAAREWLSRFYSRVTRGEPEPLAVTAAIADDTVDAMKGDCGVFHESAPVWLPATRRLPDEAGPDFTPVSIDDEDAVQPDIHPDAVINTTEGLLDADAWCDGQLRIVPHTSRWFGMQQAPFPLPLPQLRASVEAEDDDGAELCGSLCPRWLDFLGSTFEPEPASIDVLQQWFGYCLVPDITHEAILVVPGPPRSGKGTIFGVLREIVGPKSVASMSLTRLGGGFAGPGLFGRTLLMSHDTHIGRWADSVTIAEILKKISSGDSMELERKGRDVETDWCPRMKVMIATNETPKIPDASGALQARMVAVPTYKSHTGSEDRKLKRKLMAELPGVFVWALFGLRKLRKAGRFPTTRAGMEWINDYRRLNAQVAAFVADCCVEHYGSAVLTSLLRKIYLGWARKHGVGELAAEQFGANLKAAFAGVERKQITMVDGARPYFYTGIRPRLRSDDDPGEPRAMKVDSLDYIADLGFDVPAD